MMEGLRSTKHPHEEPPLWNYSWENRAWEGMLLEGLPLLIAGRVMLTRIRVCALKELCGSWLLVLIDKGWLIMRGFRMYSNWCLWLIIILQDVFNLGQNDID
jgi:hypothetical protein